MLIIKYVLLSFFILFTLISPAQTTLTGKIIDKTTQDPLPFVNVGIRSKSIGTVTNTLGIFNLITDKVLNETDKITISMIGYKSTEVKVKEFMQPEPVTISLLKDTIEISEVIVVSGGHKLKQFGSSSTSKRIIIHYNSVQAMGGEMGIHIKNKNDRFLLWDCSFNILKNDYESVKFRLNIYEMNNKLPGKNLLSENIVMTVKQKEGYYKFDLREYNITVDKDFVISIELIELNGNNKEGGFWISGALGGKIYYRLCSQDSWIIKKGLQPGFRVTVMK